MTQLATVIRCLRSGFRAKAGQVIEIALDQLFHNSPEIIEGFEPNDLLETKSTNLPGRIYLASCRETSLYKIGFSKDPSSRIYQLASATKSTIEVVRVCDVRNMIEAERAAHKLFADKRQHGEWFKLTPDDVQKFANLTGDDLHQRT